MNKLIPFRVEVQPHHTKEEIKKILDLAVECRAQAGDGVDLDSGEDTEVCPYDCVQDPQGWVYFGVDEDVNGEMFTCIGDYLEGPSLDIPSATEFLKGINKEPKSTGIQQILDTSTSLTYERSLSDIMLSLQEEVGELAQEVRVVNGHPYKAAGKDGVLGEGVDIILCVVDAIRKANPEITEKDINEMITLKLSKWVKHYNK